MIIYLPTQIQTIPPKPAYSMIEVYRPTQVPESQPKRTPLESGHFGGYVTFSGTAASGVSGSIVQGYIPEFTPTEGPIPHLLIQFDYEAHLLEIITEPRVK